MPLRCCGGVGSAMAQVEADSDRRVTSKKKLRIVFLYSETREFQPEQHMAAPGQTIHIEYAAKSSDESNNSAVKSGHICGDPLTNCGR